MLGRAQKLQGIQTIPVMLLSLTESVSGVETDSLQDQP
jgi:hypothetical protein